MVNVSSLMVFLTIFCASTLAAPLNINLGAFSPALVVGDGELSFGAAAKAEGAAAKPAAAGAVAQAPVAAAAR